MEDPRAAKGLVDRAVVRVHTAATVVEDSGLEAKDHSFLAALYWNDETNAGGIAWADVSTGYWTGLQTKKEADLWQWAQKISPRELLLPEGCALPPSLSFSETQVARVPLRSHFDPKRASERIRTAQGVAELGALGLEQR
jgi:DNA mismatch repair protein MutS